MCGIVCALRVVGGASSIRLQVLDRARRLRHRGPDWSGVYCEGPHILCHERLAIVDVKSGGQPLKSADGRYILAVNGEIYNHRELRSGLVAASPFVTDSDCEIIHHLYERNASSPADWLNQLNGMFAFVLVDALTGAFIVARDHLGIVPLYMGTDAEGAVWVASEMKAIHDICVEFEDFPPGHYYSSATNERVAWYTPQWLTEPGFMYEGSDFSLAELRSGLEAAVRRQLMSDVPYGVLLSGGLDSSLIAAIAARLCAAPADAGAGSWGTKLHSFSVGLVGSPDLAMARVVADHVGTIHHEFVFTVAEGLDALSDVIYHLETYDVTTIRAATPMYLMSRKIKCLGVKMVLSGEGSDEIFGGYLYFHRCPSASALQAECVNKLRHLYQYDELRANKSTAAWGVEARVPFLDREFVDYCMSRIPPHEKLCGRSAPSTERRIEKYILRKAFDGLLPPSVLWRQKEQFSDGVGYGWIDSIKANAEARVSDAQMAAAAYRFPHNTPPTKEAYYIRAIFERHFPQQSARLCVPGGPSVACSTAAALAWDASFRLLADASGRSVLGVHEAAYDERAREEMGQKGGTVKEQGQEKITDTQ